MSKRIKSTSLETKEAEIKEQILTDTLELNYMPYAMSVIISRAIPEIDGFKPSHRKLLYTMYKMGLLSGGRTKSSNVVGQTMKLNPHGDAAIYETLVRLTEGNSSLILPFVDSKGNFGKAYSRDMAYAAPRYTEVKLSPVCAEIFKDIDKNTVEFVDNYDSTMKEPILLPTTFPNILVNPNQGIAVGMASSFASFNLAEMCETAVAYIKNNDIDLMDYIKAPDFPTGGEILYDENEMKAIYETGRGSFKVRSRYKYDEKNSCIDIYEIPYTTTVEAIIDKIIVLVKSGKLKEINDIRDETDLNGLKITIDIRKSAKPHLLMQKLFSMTPLCDSFSCNFNLLIDGRPKVLGIKEILYEWSRFRVASIKRMTAFDIEKKSEKLHLLMGLSKILLDIDKAIRIIRNTENEKDVVPNLMSGFAIDEAQAEYIAEIKLRNINKEYILKRIDETDELKGEIEELKAILGSETKIKNIVCSQLKAVSKKYAKPRQTEIVLKSEEEKPDDMELIDDYALKLFLTDENYIKKIPLVSMRSAGEHKLKENDRIICEKDTSNRADILFFSNMQNVYKLKASEINDCKASSLGEYLPNILSMEEGEKIVYVVATLDYSGYMLFAFENGKAAKIKIESYATKANRKKLINAYSAKSSLVFALDIPEDTDIILIRDTDKATLINTALVPLALTKNASGVQVYTLKKKSKVSMAIPKEEFVSSNVEYYRSNKIPSAGHFISDDDKARNSIPMQLNLF
ncbi:MAG: DNA topoisomerase (ATP-hydrolyzing) subunit A [Lachnospiraceae bacterium]|nr:DNA topoisomerase (ATP-hydrolyzing) subunit A [Lachnospiraceae bacterium]